MDWNELKKNTAAERATERDNIGENFVTPTFLKTMKHHVTRHMTM